MIEIRSRSRVRRPQPVLRRLMRKVDARDQFMSGAQRLEAETHVELIGENRVDLIASLELAIDGDARVGHARDVTRRGRNRVPMGLAVAGGVPQAKRITHLLIVPQGAQFGVDLLFVALEQAVKIVEIHRRRFVPILLRQHGLRGRHPGDAVIRDVVLFEMEITQGQFGIVAKPERQRRCDPPTAVFHLVAVRDVTLRPHPIEAQGGL